MRFHREGNIIILVVTILLLIIGFISFEYFPNWLFWGMVILSVSFFITIAQFFRVPNRKQTFSENTIVAPADGKVVVIEKIFEDEYLKTECLQVSIFMSPMNVHQNLVPIDGTIEYYKYHKGKYLVAWHPKSSTENERNTTVLRTSSGKKVLFRQIAGALAKRICYYLKEGQEVRQNQEFGFIKFGSRVDLFLPLDAKILVSLGDISKSGVTKIAEI